MSLLPERVELKTPEQILVMRRSGKLLHRVHEPRETQVHQSPVTGAGRSPMPAVSRSSSRWERMASTLSGVKPQMSVMIDSHGTPDTFASFDAEARSARP